MMIVGLEDGTLGVLNLTKTNGQSYRRPIFTMQNQNSEMDEDPHKQFQETYSEHGDSIIVVEAAPKSDDGI